MKKFFSILLVFLMIFNAGGYFFIYFQLENHFKMIAFDGIHNYIPVENIEQIKFKRNSGFDLTGREISRLNENEILYCGKMYDIYKEEARHDTTVLYCVNDEKEDIIENAFAEFLNCKNDINKFTAVSNIIKIFITLGIQPEITDYSFLQSHKDLLNSYTFTLSKICIEIPLPPPKNIS